MSSESGIAGTRRRRHLNEVTTSVPIRLLDGFPIYPDTRWTRKHVPLLRIRTEV